MGQITRNVPAGIGVYFATVSAALVYSNEHEKEFPMGDKSDAPARGIGFFGQLIQQFRLSWALLLDNRVPWVLKLIPLGAIVYVISPLDLIPDVIPILGQLDDLGILMMALRLFNSMAPADVVDEHINRLRGGDQHLIKRKNDGTVIDVEANRD